MRYNFLLSALIGFLSVAPAVFGQVEKNVFYKVAIGDFAYTPKEEKATVGNVLEAVANVFLTGTSTKQQAQYADAVRASIVSGFGNVIRLNVVDGELDNLDNAFFVDGVISNITATSKTEPSSKKGKPDKKYYKSLISVNINLKDARTGEVVDSRTFSITDSDGSWMASAEKSVVYSLEKLSEKITTLYNHMFPLSATIIESGEVKKDKQKTVYIDLGTVYGAYKGLQFNIFESKTIAGKKANMKIGRLKIDKVLGDELSLCKVTKGEKQVKAALDNGITLTITSR